MTENDAVKTIIGILESDSTFLSLISKFSSGGTLTPELCYAPVIPQEWSLKDTTVNLYAIGSTAQREYDSMLFRASCRASDYYKSRGLALAVRNALNRKYSALRYFIISDFGATILPKDLDMENYNTPVDIRIRSVQDVD